MRTIQYLLFGKASNLDDCINISNSDRQHKVTLKLDSIELLRDYDIFKYFIGKYTWQFSDKKVEYEEVYGGYSSCAGKKRRIKSIDRSNRRLASRLKKIQKLGISIFREGEWFSSLLQCDREDILCLHCH